jgi:hypothetical protein
MAVHHFTAPDVTVARGWQPIETFPKDGTIVEVIDVHGNIYRAQWHSERILTASLSAGKPAQWRHTE